MAALIRAAAVVALLAVGGCAVSRGDLGDTLPPSAIAQIKEGQSTQAQVIALLGAPASVQQIGEQTVFHYYHYALKHGTFLVFSRVNIAGDDTYVFFDRNGIVRQVISGNRSDRLRFQFWPFGG